MASERPDKLLFALMLALLTGCGGAEALSATSTLVPLPFVSTVAVVAASDHIVYVRENSTELLADVTIGDGDRLREVAELVGVEDDEYPTFSIRVRERRKELVGLLRETTPEDAARFFAIMRECAGVSSGAPT